MLLCSEYNVSEESFIASLILQLLLGGKGEGSERIVLQVGRVCRQPPLGRTLSSWTWLPGHSVEETKL